MANFLSPKNESKKWILTAVVTIALIVIFAGLIPVTISLQKAGFEEAEVMQQYNLYVTMAAIMGLGVLALIITSLIVLKKDKNEYGNSIGFADLGGMPGFRGLKRFSTAQFCVLALIIFLILGAFMTTAPSEQTFTGVKTLPTQQFSETDSIKYSTSLGPMAENVLFAFLMGALFLTLHLLARKYQWSPSFFVTILIISAIVIGALFGVIWHNTVYPENELTRTVVGFFWGIGAFLTAATGLFIIFWEMHLVNNLSYALVRTIGQQDALLFFIISIVVTLTIYIAIWGKKPFGDKSRVKKVT